MPSGGCTQKKWFHPHDINDNNDNILNMRTLWSHPINALTANHICNWKICKHYSQSQYFAKCKLSETLPKGYRLIPRANIWIWWFFFWNLEFLLVAPQLSFPPCTRLRSAVECCSRQTGWKYPAPCPDWWLTLLDHTEAAPPPTVRLACEMVTSFPPNDIIPSCGQQWGHPGALWSSKAQNKVNTGRV